MECLKSNCIHKFNGMRVKLASHRNIDSRVLFLVPHSFYSSFSLLTRTSSLHSTIFIHSRLSMDAVCVHSINCRWLDTQWDRETERKRDREAKRICKREKSSCLHSQFTPSSVIQCSLEPFSHGRLWIKMFSLMKSNFLSWASITDNWFACVAKVQTGERGRNRGRERITSDEYAASHGAVQSFHWKRVQHREQE